MGGVLREEGGGASVISPPHLHTAAEANIHQWLLETPAEHHPGGRGVGRQNHAHTRSQWAPTTRYIKIGKTPRTTGPSDLSRPSQRLNLGLGTCHFHTHPSGGFIRHDSHLMEMYMRLHLPSYWSGAGAGNKSHSGAGGWGEGMETKNSRPWVLPRRKLGKRSRSY